MVIRVSENEFKRYDDFLEKHENGHFMQSLSWQTFKFNQKSYALMCEDDDGEVTGVMLLFEEKVRRSNKKFLYAPRGPVCSREDTAALSELLAEAEKLAEEIGAYKLTLDPDITADDKVWLDYFDRKGAIIGENETENAILQPFAVYRIDVNKTDDELMASYHSKARYSVRASIKSEATCRLGNRDDIPEFCRLLADTAKRDGFASRGEKYFYDMYDLLGEDMVKIFMVECEGRAIAGSVVIACAGKSWHMYAGSSEEYKETMPNFLMQWEMMRWSRDNGYYLYDMRGIAGGADKLKPIEGLVRFKKRFGGELVSFVGRIDIVYDKKTDRKIKTLFALISFARKLLGRK